MRTRATRGADARHVTGAERAARVLAGAVLATVVVALLAGPAGACGGLVGENGTIRLERTATLAAYHDGVERYVTSFEFSGEGKAVGSIVPLPDVPTDVERGGDWTLQRLEREVAPPVRSGFAEDRAVASTAAHITPRLLASTTRYMPVAKSGVRTKNSRTRPGEIAPAARSRSK